MKRKKIALMMVAMMTVAVVGTEPAAISAQEMGEEIIQDGEEQETEDPDNAEMDLTEENTDAETDLEETDDLELSDTEDSSAAVTDKQDPESDFNDGEFSDGTEDVPSAGYKRGDFNLNDEITLEWQKENDWTKVWFTPEKTQSYVITISENAAAGRTYSLYNYVDDENASDQIMFTETLFSNVNGKTYLKTPELQAGETYYLCFDATSGETKTQVGIYDDPGKLWESATSVGAEITDSIDKGRSALSWGEAIRQETTKIYKITAPASGYYTYQVSGLKQIISDDEYSYDVTLNLYDDNGISLSGQSTNYENSDTVDVSGKLDDGKTYYLKICNYSLYNSYTYNITRTFATTVYQELTDGTEGTLERDDSCLYKVKVDKDGTYQFKDSTVSRSGEKLFYMYDSRMEDITDQGETRVYEEQKSESSKNGLFYTIQLEEGTYYLKLKNCTEEKASYKIAGNKITLKDVESIKLSATYMKLEVGQKKDLTVSLNPSDSTFKFVHWNISNIHAADRVYNEEKDISEIVGKAAGTCDITVIAKNGKSAVCHVEVVDGHEYQTVTTPATLTKDGSIVTKCTICGDVKEKTAIARPTKFQLSAAKYTYDGKVKTPSVTVTDSKGKKLTAADYSVSYSTGRKEAGTYYATIRFKGKYQGTKSLAFTIAKANPKLTVKASAPTLNAGAKGKLTVAGAKGTIGYETSDRKIATISNGIATGIKTGTVTITVSSTATKNYNKATAKITLKIRPTSVSVLKAASAKSGQITVSWKKNTTTDRYQIQYSTNSKFQKASTVTVTSNAKTSQTLTKLAGKKKYYVRMRSVDKTGKLYSNWSKVLTVTTK